ncbi:hypothetical protein IWZ00DRAFT_308599 [Phyllosticta capitalensis]
MISPLRSRGPSPHINVTMDRQPSSQAKSIPTTAPHPLHLAFAIAVVKSKPIDLSVKEYILRLRESFRPVRDSRDPHASQPRFDPAAFWQKRCERAEATHAGMQAQILDLERALEKLKISSGAAAQEPQAGPARRKTAKPAASKRKRDLVDVDDGTSADIDALEGSGTEGPVLARHLYKAHKLSNEADFNSSDLSYHLVQACQSLTALVLGARQRYEQRISSKDPLATAGSSTAIPGPVMGAYQKELRTTFETATRSFAGLLGYLSKLAESASSTKEATSAVVFEVVSGFSRIMDNMRDTARTEALSSLSEDGQPRRSQKSKKSQEGVDVAHELFKFLFSCLAAPSPTDFSHRQVFEGFLFVILQRCGKCVFQCSFGHESTGTIEGDMRAWNHPEGDGLVAGSPDEKAMSLELQYLVLLFRRAIVVAPNYLVQEDPASTSAKPKRQRTATTTNRKVAKASASTLRAGLGVVARNRLQQTLFNAVFGEGPSSDEFMDCLRMPTQPGSTPQIPKQEQKDVKSWFEEQLWNVLGWDILQQAVEAS